MKKNKKNLLIIGAGVAGRQLAREIKISWFNYEIIGFLDDFKVGTVEGIKITGKIKNLQKIISIFKINEVIIAFPSLSYTIAEKIFNICLSNCVICKILPADSDIIEGRAKLQNLREIEISDILKKSVQKKDFEKLGRLVKNNIFLVTGGAGSIGMEIVKQLAFLDANKVVVIDNCELGIFNLKNNYKKYKNIVYYIADILDKERIQSIIKKEKIEIIFHAAAYKHVGLMEENIYEAIKNNIFGTKQVFDCAVKYKVKKFVLVSTDKAVNPTSIMGKTKRIAEKLILCYKNSELYFNIVRFGNVMDSSGSVLPIFRQQIIQGGPITVTSAKAMRYFMSIPEAVQLIISTINYKVKNKIFLLEMGQQYKILDIAIKMSKLKGLVPYKDIKIIFTGLKNGEKLKEELYLNKKFIKRTNNKKIYYLANDDKFNRLNFLNNLAQLENNYKNIGEKKMIKIIDNLIIN